MSFHEDRLRTLAPETLKGMRRGIEKESLRVRSDGALSQAPHPPALGSPLTHPHITTDFSEAQLELITGVHDSVDACLQELTWIHQVVYRHIGDEILWCASMPCNLPADNQIRSGATARRTVGARRPCTASAFLCGTAGACRRSPASTTQLVAPRRDRRAVLRADRNFRRHSWLPIYLSAPRPRCVELRRGPQSTRCRALSPHHVRAARDGRCAWDRRLPERRAVRAVRQLHDLKSYSASLDEALTKPIPLREGRHPQDDNYRQLSTSLLQIENGFYGTSVPSAASTRASARCTPCAAAASSTSSAPDGPDAFCPIGIWPATCRLLDVFLLHLPARRQPADTPQGSPQYGATSSTSRCAGREPKLNCRKIRSS